LKNGNNKNTVIKQINEVLNRTFGKTIENATQNQLYKAFAITVKNEIMDKWAQSAYTTDDKRVYYLSIEFLMGRALSNNILNIGKRKDYQEACKQLGLDFDSIASREPEAGLGNGGLGRLAACFMDSLATLDLPAYGCGIRYEYGLFRQKIIDGWLHTGDLARRNNGYYKITGRLKDMIIRGGENIYPKEIEDFIYTHPKVKDVQVIGVPDEGYGEEIMAVVILKDNETMTEKELKDYVRTHMAKHKTPRYVEFVEEFPMNAAGKILKYKMRENAIEKLKLQKANGIVTA
jgi:acyl-CoA synthetase (AMP-forming)/AMP-acid ligase II